MTLTPEIIAKTFDECMNCIISHGYFREGEKRRRMKSGEIRVYPSKSQFEMARWMTDHILAVWRG